MNLEEDRGYLARPCSYFECFTKFIHTIILLNDWTEVVCYTTTNEIIPSGQGLGCNTIIDFTENKSEGIDWIERGWILDVIVLKDEVKDMLL